MLVTSKNHDLKSEVAEQASLDQRLGIRADHPADHGGLWRCRKLRDLANERRTRQSLGFALAPPTPAPGGHVQRDIQALLEFLPSIFGRTPWDGLGSFPFVDVCPWDGQCGGGADHQPPAYPLPGGLPPDTAADRRDRGRSSAVRTSTKAARIEAKSLNGLTGDPWALVDHRDKKGR